ncbi:MAG: TRAP transporter large permease, partial [Gammaproteobacteria bacterium]|nr:TRAP transporter large permease [Gammaproteobacteria bacterium]
MIIEPITIGLIGLCLLVVLVVIGMHVAYAGALVGLIGIVITIGARRVREGDFWDIIEKGWAPGLANAGTIPFSELAHYSLSVLPMFI